AGVGHGQVRQDLLDEQLRRAVGVGGGQPGVLGDRYPFGVSVDRGGRAEDQVTYPVFVHHLGEVQQRVEVVAVVAQEVAHRLAHGWEPGHGDGGVDLVFCDDLTQRRGIDAVRPVEGDPFTGDVLDPADALLVAVDEGVDAHDPVPGVEEFVRRVGADVSGATGEQYVHRAVS